MKATTKNKVLCVTAGLFAIVVNVIGITLLGILKSYQEISATVHFISIFCFHFNLTLVAVLIRKVSQQD